MSAPSANEDDVASPNNRGHAHDTFTPAPVMIHIPVKCNTTCQPAVDEITPCLPAANVTYFGTDPVTVPDLMYWLYAPRSEATDRRNINGMCPMLNDYAKCI